MRSNELVMVYVCAYGVECFKLPDSQSRVLDESAENCVRSNACDAVKW